MASFDSQAFTRDSDVLRFRAPKDPLSRWVLWPVFAWKVVAPRPREREINLFQRAILGLARAGVVQLDEVADRLQITRDLVGVVANELRNLGMTNHEWRPTDRGLRALDNADDDPPQDLHLGNVLSDPFTGKLWPRFVTGDMPVADVEPNPKGWPVLLSGSVGDPWRDPAFCLLPNPGEVLTVVQPSVRDILRVTRRHRRQREVDEVTDERVVPTVEQVSFIDNVPRAYLLALRVCSHPSGDWMVDDPFGHGENFELRKALEQRLATQRGLSEWLRSLVGGDPEAPTLSGLQAQAVFDVKEILTLAITQHETLCERLVAMRRAQLEASLTDAPPDKWDDVVVKAQRAAERTLSMVHEAHFPRESSLWSALTVADKRLNLEMLNAIARDIGLETPLPTRLASVGRREVQDVERRGSGSLRPLLVLTLLGADQEPSHPLHRCARANPRLLQELDALATTRNRSAHDGPDLRPQEVPGHVAAVYSAVESLVLTR